MVIQYNKIWLHKNLIEFFLNTNLQVQKLHMKNCVLITIETRKKFQMTLLWPSDVKHFQIVFHNSNFLFLVRLVEVFQNDGDVHVDDNHVVDDDETDKIGDGKDGLAAIAVGQIVLILVAVGRLDHQRVKHVVPTSRGH